MNVKLGALPTLALALSLAYSSGAGAQVGSTTEDPMTVFSKLQPSMTEGRKLAVQAINDAKAILTPAQWTKVPESIKTPGLRRGDGEGRGERGGPGNG